MLWFTLFFWVNKWVSVSTSSLYLLWLAGVNNKAFFIRPLRGFSHAMDLESRNKKPCEWRILHFKTRVGRSSQSNCSLHVTDRLCLCGSRAFLILLTKWSVKSNFRMIFTFFSCMFFLCKSNSWFWPHPQTSLFIQLCHTLKMVYFLNLLDQQCKPSTWGAHCCE
jgi:hypothetical protein